MFIFSGEIGWNLIEIAGDSCSLFVYRVFCIHPVVEVALQVFFTSTSASTRTGASTSTSALAKVENSTKYKCNAV